MFNNDEIYKIVRMLNIKFDKYPFEDFKRGIMIELEHGKVNPKTNVTDDDLLKTANIALAHLDEYPNYYNKDYGLLKFEEYLKNML